MEVLFKIFPEQAVGRGKGIGEKKILEEKWMVFQDEAFGEKSVPLSLATVTHNSFKPRPCLHFVFATGSVSEGH